MIALCGEYMVLKVKTISNYLQIERLYILYSGIVCQIYIKTYFLTGTENNKMLHPAKSINVCSHFPSHVICCFALEWSLSKCVEKNNFILNNNVSPTPFLPQSEHPQTKVSKFCCMAWC